MTHPHFIVPHAKALHYRFVKKAIDIRKHHLTLFVTRSKVEIDKRHTFARGGVVMASLGLSHSPYALSATEVDKQVTRTSAGNYALGTYKDGTFYVHYVGRSDSDVNQRLKDHVAAGTYSHFKFDYATSPKAAFEKECANYHDFGGSQKLDNTIHPDRPANAGWKCPHCNTFG